MDLNTGTPGDCSTTGTACYNAFNDGVAIRIWTASGTITVGGETAYNDGAGDTIFVGGNAYYSDGFTYCRINNLGIITPVGDCNC